MIQYVLQKIAADHKRITVSTVLTLFRIVLVPVIVGAMVAGWWGSAFFLFIIAALTDMLDGMLARMLNQQTFLGACLDPIADKLLIVSIFSTLAFVSTPLFTIPNWFVFTVLAKEVVQIGGAALVYWAKGDLLVRPTIVGKITMVLQTFFIVWLFACYFFSWVPIKTYYVMLGSLLVFIGSSFVLYAYTAICQLRARD